MDALRQAKLPQTTRRECCGTSRFFGLKSQVPANISNAKRLVLYKVPNKGHTLVLVMLPAEQSICYLSFRFATLLFRFD